MRAPSKRPSKRRNHGRHLRDEKDIWNVIFAKKNLVFKICKSKGMNWAEDCERFINKLFG